MISKALQRLFNAIYTILKLSFYFWVLTLAGVVITGPGPALQAISDLYVRHHFNYHKLVFKDAWALFKHYWRTKNIWFWCVAALIFALSYNLYLSTQFQGWFWLFIDFILLFALAFVVSASLSALVLQSHFEVAECNLLKLAIMQFFNKFGQVVVLILGLALLGFLTWKFKALLLFFSIPLMVIWADMANHAYVRRIEEELTEK